MAATLGARLGPDWTAAGLVRWVTEQRDRPILADPAAPLAYLRALLDETLTGAAAPPYPARRHDEHRRAATAAAGQAQQATQARQRAALDDRDRAAADHTTRSAADQLAALRARLPGGRRRDDRVALLDTTAAGGEDWPETAQPGSGLPPAMRRRPSY